MLKKLVIVVKITNYFYDEVMVILLWPPIQYRGATSIFDAFFNAWLRPCPCPCNHDYCWFYFVKQELLFLCLIDKIRWFLDFEGPEKLILPPRSLLILFWSTRIVDSVFFNDQKSWSTRIVDSGLLNDQKCWFYSNTESTFCTPPGIRGLQIPTLLFLCWTETTKWVTESTKWTYTSTKWDTETAKWVTETTKWVSTKQQNGAQFLYPSGWADRYHNFESIITWSGSTWEKVPPDVETRWQMRALGSIIVSVLFLRW